MRKDKTTIIYEEFCCELQNFILKRVKDKSHADDIFQDVFIKIHNSIDSLKDETKIRSWIFQITRNTIADYYRTQKYFDRENPTIIFFENFIEDFKYIQKVKVKIFIINCNTFFPANI